MHDNCERVTDEDIAFLAALPQHMSFEADGIAYLMQHQMLDNSYDMPESVQTFDAFWRVWYAGREQAGAAHDLRAYAPQARASAG